MKLHIKNMVCDRCKMVVKAELESIGLNPIAIELGEVTLLDKTISEEQLEKVKETLSGVGFELLEERTKVITEKIKTLIIDLVHYTAEPLKVNLSSYLSDKLGMDYSQLSALFSNTAKITIEHYYIRQKIERVKELLAYNELTLSEIAFQLNYSSVAHLSAQFKKETGLTPSQFKSSSERNTIDKI